MFAGVFECKQISNLCDLRLRLPDTEVYGFAIKMKNQLTFLFRTDAIDGHLGVHQTGKSCFMLGFTRKIIVYC